MRIGQLGDHPLTLLCKQVAALISFFLCFFSLERTYFHCGLSYCLLAMTDLDLLDHFTASYIEIDLCYEACTSVQTSTSNDCRHRSRLH